MDLAFIGAGYVGLVSAAIFAEKGHKVFCVDHDQDRIFKLNNLIIPIYEPGLKELVAKNLSKGRLIFTSKLAEAIAEAKVIFITVGTPSLNSGQPDLAQVIDVAGQIGQNLSEYKIIVNKSTVPVGTGELVTAIINKNLNNPIDFDVVSVPEFLREGSALEDALNPERVVIGTEREKALAIIKDLYKFTGATMVSTDLRSAEMIKYAANAFLATKITFINEIANLCEKVGADVGVVAYGMGLDSRIGKKFLKAGIGYGGSCLPKDAKALINLADNQGYDFKLLKAVVTVNQSQSLRIIDKLKLALGDLKNKTVTVLGLAFKPNTDDLRDAPSLEIIKALQREGVKIKAYDPVAVPGARKILTGLTFYSSPYPAIKNSNAILILTEWEGFCQLDLIKVKAILKQPVIIDGRNLFEPAEMEKLGFRYHSIGRGGN